MKIARAAVHAENRLRGGWRSGGRHPIHGGTRLSTWRRPRSPTPTRLQKRNSAVIPTSQHIPTNLFRMSSLLMRAFNIVTEAFASSSVAIMMMRI